MPFDAEVSQTNTDKLILQRARDRIAGGWCQGELEDDGKFCLLGAIAVEADLDRAAMASYEYELAGIEKYTKMLGFEKPILAELWNDYDRTQAEVLARFDEAIARLG